MCGFTGAEVWPLTGWKLFSQVRTDTETAWSAVRFDAGGRETPVDFSALGRGYTGYLHVMARSQAMASSRREEICQTWLAALRRPAGGGVGAGPVPAPGEDRGPVGVRIYRVVRTLGPDHRPAVTSRRLTYECR